MESSLIGPMNPLGFPAPYWFLVLFKVLGLTLHWLPMHIWYAGVITMLILRARGGEHAVRLSTRVLDQMPVVIAWGVNLGIVPLLFVQVAYYRAFYPAGVLMAWPWFSVIVLLTLAYYGVYFIAFGVRDGRVTRARRAGGWVAALFFVAIGFLFANNFSLMTNVSGWRPLWAATSVAGAPLGTGLNVADPTLWPRWLMVFGLALQTTAVWCLFDAGVFAGREGPGYRRWVAGWVLKLHALGIVWFAATGSWYVFGAMRPDVRARVLALPRLILTIPTMLWPGVVWLALLLAWRRARERALGEIGRGLAITALLAQVVTLALNTVSRQFVQNDELRRYVDVTAEPVHTQWSTLVLFLVLFVATVGVVVWMARQATKAARRPVAD